MSRDFVDTKAFYAEYHGHKVDHLQKLLPHLRRTSRNLIWTAGDSSLDNKYWFRTKADAVGAYADVLRPQQSICDVTYWLNYLANKRLNDGTSKSNLAAINTAVEATTLNERSLKLRPQDIFLRDNIKQDDILIVSIGGNDVALYPTPCTIASMASIMCLPPKCVENSTSFFTVPCNDYCCGCSSSLLSCAGTCPPCFGYMRHLFGMRVQKYIEALTHKTKPKKILVCMIYYPDENVESPSWAGAALGALGYNSHPEKLQTVIKKSFEEATCNIKISGTQVIPVPLFIPLDGKNSRDYIARVEPSAQGGEKMAEFLLKMIDNDDSITDEEKIQYQSYQSPSPSAAFISGRE